jgi:hypothetical protein
VAKQAEYKTERQRGNTLESVKEATRAEETDNAQDTTGPKKVSHSSKRFADWHVVKRGQGAHEVKSASSLQRKVCKVRGEEGQIVDAAGAPSRDEEAQQVAIDGNDRLCDEREFTGEGTAAAADIERSFARARDRCQEVAMILSSVIRHSARLPRKAPTVGLPPNHALTRL